MGYLALGIACLQIVLDKGQEDDWFSSNFIRTLCVLTIIGLTAFIIRELTTEHPVVDLSVFKIRTYATGVFLMTVLGFVLYGSTVLIPLLLQTLLGYPALQAGIAMLPRGLGSFVAMPVVGALLARVKAHYLLVCGVLLGAFAMWRLSHLTMDVGYWNFFGALIWQGVGMGLIFIPLTTITNDPIPRERYQHLQSDEEHRREHRDLDGSNHTNPTRPDTRQYAYSQRHPEQPSGAGTREWGEKHDDGARGRGCRNRSADGKWHG